MEFVERKKLVRDNIPYICMKDGRYFFGEVLGSDTEFLHALLEKLNEELAEVEDAILLEKGDPLEELVDLVTVWQTLCGLLGFSEQAILDAWQVKADEKGLFKKRYFMHGIGGLDEEYEKEQGR